MKKKLELSQIRFKYKEDKLSIKNSNNNPFNQFSKWMNQAIKNKVFEPTAMSLATIDKKKVSNRIVLLKYIKNNTLSPKESMSGLLNVEYKKGVLVELTIVTGDIQFVFKWDPEDSQN